MSLTSNKTYYASGSYTSNYTPDKAFDENTTTLWHAAASGGNNTWICVDLGADLGTRINKLRIKPVVAVGHAQLKDFTLSGSNDSTNGADGTWTTIMTGIHQDNDLWEEYTFTASAIFRFFKITVNTSYRTDYLGGGIYEIELFECIQYKLNGAANWGPFAIPVFTEDPESTAIEWTDDVPTGTSIEIQTAISTVTPEADEFQTVTNGAAIPGLDVSAAGKNLYIKAILTTDDTLKSPKLSSIGYSILEQPDTTKIQINLSSAGRMKYPAESVNIKYDKTKGNLLGILGGQVESFEKEFAAQNIIPVFNPNDFENITAQIHATISTVEVTYRYAQVDIENVTAQASAAITVTKVGSLPL